MQLRLRRCIAALHLPGDGGPGALAGQGLWLRLGQVLAGGALAPRASNCRERQADIRVDAFLAQVLPCCQSGRLGQAGRFAVLPRAFLAFVGSEGPPRRAGTNVLMLQAVRLRQVANAQPTSSAAKPAPLGAAAVDRPRATTPARTSTSSRSSIGPPSPGAATILYGTIVPSSGHAAATQSPCRSRSRSPGSPGRSGRQDRSGGRGRDRRISGRRAASKPCHRRSKSSSRPRSCASSRSRSRVRFSGRSASSPSRRSAPSPSQMTSLRTRTHWRACPAPPGRRHRHQACRLCRCSPSDRDLVENASMRWSKVWPDDGTAQGAMCYYCDRVMRRQYPKVTPEEIEERLEDDRSFRRRAERPGGLDCAGRLCLSGCAMPQPHQRCLLLKLLC